MTISVFEIFKVGIGPSSSHTVGPMRAAGQFLEKLDSIGRLHQTRRIRIELFGSLGATGRGHGTDKAIYLGLEGEEPGKVDPAQVQDKLERIAQRGEIDLLGVQRVFFEEKRDLIFNPRESLPFHPNGMRFSVFDGENGLLSSGDFYSIGGGFVADESAASSAAEDVSTWDAPYPFANAADLLRFCQRDDKAISEIMLANELQLTDESSIRQRLLHIWQVMQDCVDAGCRHEGVLPGRMRVKRRAPSLNSRLRGMTTNDPLQVMDWVNLYALAVNEENAAGGRVVTAPTNGAAGIVPAVLHYYVHHWPGAIESGVVNFLLTAGAIGVLYKKNASISGAEVGCQGEVGSACSMAAAGLCEVIGGTPNQVENAAEIAMEHNLGLTCDPIDGLVQVPCIERNAIAANKAINAARMALKGDGSHVVSLDSVIKTMWETGEDMKVKYKETAQGGLAVNVIEC